MSTENLRRILARRPFRPLRITLLSGEECVVRHPENIGVVGAMVIVATAPETDFPYFFESDAIASVEVVQNGRRARR